MNIIRIAHSDLISFCAHYDHDLLAIFFSICSSLLTPTFSMISSNFE